MRITLNATQIDAIAGIVAGLAASWPAGTYGRQALANEVRRVDGRAVAEIEIDPALAMFLESELYALERQAEWATTRSREMDLRDARERIHNGALRAKAELELA